ncbi:Pc20g10510 [Penicillium rubens Wisconsin 54-1255]|uniref:Pc20g10510 protein n=1 Tax=Penicillium rubens (strain ATCC 28089 / DSM 1075 / NRRL 1951 / Wisconsin 54-1255) TaxID=500485 RepID=B6HFU6_PENRW|nr:Pc20g10510 [Penicillium rubens Wisconsin 54-1255]
MSSPAVSKAPPKLGSKAGTPTKARKDSGSSAASKPSTAASPKATKKSTTPRKLSQKAPEPLDDDIEEQSVPETPSPKSKKRTEQRRPTSPPDDVASQAPSASGSAAPLGRASGVTGKAKGLASKTKETPQQGSESVQNDAKNATQTATDNLPVPFDMSALKGLDVAEGGNILGQNGTPIGKIVEGDAEELVGQTVGDDGEILDEEGDLIGRVDILHEVADQANNSADDAQQNVGEVDLENVVTDIAQLEGLTVSDGGVIKNTAGQTVGRIVEGDPEDLIGYTLNDDGEIVDEEGDAIGRVDLIPVEEQKKAIEGASGDVTDKVGGAKDDLEDQYEDAQDGLSTDQVDDAKDTAEDGQIELENANEEASDTLNEKAEGATDTAEDATEEAKDTTEDAGEEAQETAEDAVEEVEKQVPGLETLEGKVCNKLGYIIDKATGKPLGATLDNKGQFWDNRGNVIGQAKTLPIEEDEGDEGPFSGLEGLVVGEDGFVEDENSNRVGRLIEGDAKKLSGRGVDEDGEILDRKGNVIGRAERLEPEEEETGPDFSAVNGLSCNKAGYVIGPEGYPIARVVEGNPKELAGKKIEDGEIYDGKKVVGRVELIPEDEIESKPEGPFAGMESLFVTKDGFVEDDEGSIVGKLIEGDPKKLRGRAVDEDGEITDKYGNVKGRAEPYEPPQEEAPTEEDLSILEGKVVNKAGNVVDPTTGAVVGRIVEGDKRLAGCKVDGKGQIWGDNGKIVGRAELIPGAEQNKAEGPFYGFDNAVVGKDGVVQNGEKIIGRLIEGDAKRLLSRKVDEDGDVLDKNGNTIGKAERWEPEEKKRVVNPMSGRKITKEGEVRDADGNLIGKLTSGNLATLIGKTVDDNGYVVDNDGNKIGECTLLENIPEPEPEAEEEERPTPEEQEAAAKAESDRQLAQKMISILSQTLDQVKPVCKQIAEACEKADRTPKDELDEEKLVQTVKPLLEEGGRILQECNGAIRALDPDGRIAATAKARAASRDATPEEYQLADMIKELTETVIKTIDNGKRRIADMPHAKKKLSPLWGLLSEPLFQIIAAVGLLLNGVLGLVGRLLDGLGLGGLLNGLLGSLGLDKLINGLGLGSLTDALGLGKK